MGLGLGLALGQDYSIRIAPIVIEFKVRDLGLRVRVIDRVGDMV